MLSDRFFAKLNDMSKRLGMNPRDLLLVMFIESAGVNPVAKNPSGAVGLIQFMPQTLKNLGLDQKQIDNFQNTSAEDQLDLVERYIRGNQGFIGGKNFTSATQYYHSNFFPLTLKRWKGTNPIANANVIVVSSHSKSKQERAAYRENQVLDYNKDGRITVGDLTATLMSNERNPRFQALLQRLNSVAGSGNVSEKTDHKQEEEPGAIEQFFAYVEHFIDKLLKSSDSRFGITVVGSNYVSRLEFAYILKTALQEELNVDATIHSDGDVVEILTVIPTREEDGKSIIKELCRAVSSTFTFATRQLKPIVILSHVENKMNSNYQEIGINIAEENHARFCLQFPKRNINGNR